MIPLFCVNNKNFIDFNIFLIYNCVKDKNIVDLWCEERNMKTEMEKIGVIKEIDRLGRIVIPKEFRQRYGLTTEVELVATKEGILMKNQEYVLTQNKK